MEEKTIPLGKLPVDVKVQMARGNSSAQLDYRALFEQTSESVFIIGLDFRFITANPQALKLFGYQEHELIGMRVEEIMMLEDLANPAQLIEERARSSEQDLRKKDGSIIPVELNITVVHDEKGMPAYIQMIAHDISERRQAERNLKRHMRALSVIGEVTASLFRSPDLQERLPEVLESLGYAVGVFSCVIFELKGGLVAAKYKWTDHTAPGFDPLSVIQPYAESLSEIPERVFSVTDLQTDHASVPHVSVLVIPIQGLSSSWGFLALLDKEDRLSWLPSIFDIVQTTANLIAAALERAQYEESLHLSLARNRVIVNALPDLLLRIDSKGQILDFFANEKHPLFRHREQTMGRNIFDLLPKNSFPNMTGVESVFVTPQKMENIKIPQLPDSILEAQIHPISSSEALVIVRDVTEQARLDQMKSDFINRASHELRTPLTAAILMTELIQAGGTPEEMEEYWRTLTGELNRQKNLINELLMAGRLESGAMKLEAVPLDLLPVLQDAIQSVKPMALKKRISIPLNTDLRALEVLGDKSGLQQVFINLINNAVKFSPEGGRVDVNISVDETHASVGVVDQGLGIPPESISHLFERFYRAKNVTVAEIPGSGIGLYIVKSIVDELGGEILVDSRINQGTTFTVKLRVPH